MRYKPSKAKSSDAGLLLLLLAFGWPIYLITEYPVIFFAVVLPLAVIGIIAFVMWLKK